MNLFIRAAEPGDIAAMTGLLGALFAIEKDFTPNREKQERGLALLLDGSPHRAALVADHGGSVVGMVTGQILVSTAEGGLTALVEDLVVAPAFRGRGVGSRLLAGINGWARAAGAVRLQLLADRDNGPALDFYGRAGWRETNLFCLRNREPETTLCPGRRGHGQREGKS